MGWFGKRKGKETGHGSAEAALRAALSAIIDPRNDKDVLSGGLVSAVHFSKPSSPVRATLTLELPGGKSPLNDQLEDEIRKAAEAIEGIEKVTIVSTAHKKAPPAGSPAQAARASSGGGHSNPMGVKGAKVGGDISLPQVKRIIAVVSGKGGVGKSTIAANLAVTLARLGHKVGLMDADIHGPSLPVLFGIKGRAEFANDKVQPVKVCGLSAMSIGLLVEEEKALAWRGPMVMGAVQQMFTEVDWPPLDIMVIDTPPGTGDTHLTLLQKIKLSGAIIVSTPQEMALADVRRGAELFKQMGAPVLGLIENMAWLEMPDGTRSHLFGQGGASAAAEKLGLPVLAEMPLIPDMQKACDAGIPYMASDAESEAGAIFYNIAKSIEKTLDLAAPVDAT